MHRQMSPCVRRAVTLSRDPDQAARELYTGLYQPHLSLVLLFCSADHDLAALAPALTRCFGPAPVVGCTTAGEITPAGYLRGAIVGISLAGPDFLCSAELLGDLRHFNMAQGRDLVHRALHRLLRLDPDLRRSRIFGMLMIDGLSNLEEGVVSSLHSVMGEIPLFGGSAGDTLSFRRTCVLYYGAFRDNAAVLVLVASRYRFRVFKTDHFASSHEKMVVTEADPVNRVVTEINAEPAAREYARVVGLEVDALTPMIFATHPVMVRVGGDYFVRSIQKVNANESLSFFCAIDEGIVLTVARGVDLAQNLAELFENLRTELGPPQLVIGCDCVLRLLELDQKALRDEVGRMMIANNVIGFATFGEQFNAMHVNQTFTGVAIGTEACS